MFTILRKVAYICTLVNHRSGTDAAAQCNLILARNEAPEINYLPAGAGRRLLEGGRREMVGEAGGRCAIGSSRDLWRQMDEGFSRICATGWRLQRRRGIMRSVVVVRKAEAVEK